MAWLLFQKVMLQLKEHELIDLTFCSGVAHLDVNDGSRDPLSAWNFDQPPPAPKLTSQGVVAMDITEQFVSAAKRMPSLHPSLPLF
jgi:hypothetical protein